VPPLEQVERKVRSRSERVGSTCHRWDRGARPAGGRTSGLRGHRGASTKFAPSYPYYRVKLDTERVIEGSPVPYAILRATQFHDLVLMAIRFLERMPVVVVPSGFPGQPIDAGEVAGRLVEPTLSDPAGRVPDIGGPEVRTVAEIVRGYLEVTGRRKRTLMFRLPGKTARAFREGALTCPNNRYGEIRWEEFLCGRVLAGWR
jgi:uncharacterized protein YbjT (DUF2867 family)